jgi:hypothetical protein
MSPYWYFQSFDIDHIYLMNGITEMHRVQIITYLHFNEFIYCTAFWFLCVSSPFLRYPFII